MATPSLSDRAALLAIHASDLAADLHRLRTECREAGLAEAARQLLVAHHNAHATAANLQGLVRDFELCS